jgi:hypothetical protein
MQRAKAVTGMQEIVSLAQQADVRSVSCALATISTVGFSPHRDGQVASTFSVPQRADLALRGFGCISRDLDSTWWSFPLIGAHRLRLRTVCVCA